MQPKNIQLGAGRGILEFQASNQRENGRLYRVSALDPINELPAHASVHFDCLASQKHLLGSWDIDFRDVQGQNIGKTGMFTGSESSHC